MQSAAEGVERQRIRCAKHQDLLRDLARIHVRIDTPDRPIRADDPDWIPHLRKVCLHAVAISACEVDVDGVHAMAPELRAAYRQMAGVWPHVPREHGFEESCRDWWAEEARTGLLATYDHPTPLSLSLPLASGGFGDSGNPWNYVQLMVWLGRLGLGYGLALAHLARVLGAAGGVESQLGELLERGAHLVPDITEGP